MYVRDSGGFQTEQIERDVHAYIAAGFYPGMKGDPYEATMYAAWQERATQDSHKGLSRIAGEVGASHLHKAAGVMAGDEGRHAKFYKTIAGEIFRLDPENAISSFERLVRRGLTMPGDTMQGFNAVIEASTRAGIYGPQEYLDILQELINEWGIGEISLSGDADKKRYEVINRHARLSKIIQRGTNREPSDALNVIEERWLK
jgi:acyl-[acyl-carrier-protein] desaturase